MKYYCLTAYDLEGVVLLGHDLHSYLIKDGWFLKYVEKKIRIRFIEGLAGTIRWEHEGQYLASLAVLT